MTKTDELLANVTFREDDFQLKPSAELHIDTNFAKATGETRWRALKRTRAQFSL